MQELKGTRINQLITKGFTKDEMRESNVDWLGKIPITWNVDCVKQHFRIEKRIAGEEGYDVFSITQQGIKIKDISKNEGQMAQNYANYQFVYPGEFAMNHTLKSRQRQACSLHSVRAYRKTVYTLYFYVKEQIYEQKRKRQIKAICLPNRIKLKCIFPI